MFHLAAYEPGKLQQETYFDTAICILFINRNFLCNGYYIGHTDDEDESEDEAETNPPAISTSTNGGLSGGSGNATFVTCTCD